MISTAPSPINNYDDWLAAWSQPLRAVGRDALDVGCGPGYDTEVLTRWGLSVTACDLTADALEPSRTRNRGATHVLADALTLSPFSAAAFDLVVASLSLHYFDRDNSHRAFASVARVLKAGGFFAFRVNAWDDYEFGAPRERLPWEPVNYRGKTKQFFTEEMIGDVLAGRFEVIALRKDETYRYGKRKSFFAVLARTAGLDPGRILI